MHQTSSVDDYIKEFVARSAQDIRARVRSADTWDLYRTIQLACEVEFEVDVHHRSGALQWEKHRQAYGLGDKAGSVMGHSSLSIGFPKPYSGYNIQSSILSTSVSQPTKGAQLAGSTGNSSSNIAQSIAGTCNVRRYSQKEYQELRKKGALFSLPAALPPTSLVCYEDVTNNRSWLWGWWPALWTSFIAHHHNDSASGDWWALISAGASILWYEWCSYFSDYAVAW